MRIIITLFALVQVLFATSQTEHILTQNARCAVTWNPAFITQHDTPLATLAYRKAWNGISAAPQIYLLNAFTPLAEGKVGAGLLMKNETFGTERRATVMLDGAYAIHGVNSVYSFGLRVGVENVFSSLSDVFLIDADDKNFRYSYDNILLPNVGFGLAAGNKQWGAGFSVPRLLQSEVLQNATSVEVKQKAVFSELHTCLYGFKKHQLSERMELQGSLFGRTVGHRLPYCQAALQCTYNKLITLGASYQYKHSASALLILNWKEVFSMGYSYDFPMGSSISSFGASHEFVLSSKFAW